jgi:hypothetical protein
VAVGCPDNETVRMFGGRVETFEIDYDEQLIGCELHQGPSSSGRDYFQGLTFLKYNTNE